MSASAIKRPHWLNHTVLGIGLASLLTKQASEELHLAEGDRVIALVKAPHIHLIPH